MTTHVCIFNKTFYSLTFTDVYFLKGINKSSAVINFICGELTRIERFSESSVNCMEAGHTKFDPDRLFGWVNLILARINIENALYVFYILF